ncbi:MAG: hypothetical protein ACI4NE_06375 [Succinivibrio sp.]
MIDIQLSQTVFSWTGITVTGLSILCILSIRRIRFGILMLLLSNLFYWTAIIFPKKAVGIIEALGVQIGSKDNSQMYFGIATGLGIFVFFYILRSVFFRLFPPKKKLLTEKEDEKTKKENTETDLIEKAKQNKETERIEPGFGEVKSVFADPAMFQNVQKESQVK